MVMLTYGSRDGETMQKDNSSGSTKSPRLSEINNGRTMPWRSKAMVAVATLELLLVSLQDGGNYSDL
jgi:hypothetical protein